MAEGKRGPRKTIASLRLDIDSALAGKTWLLLPEGFRAQECGKTYPLPSYLKELHKIVLITIPPTKLDAGCIYIRRALKVWKRKRSRKPLDQALYAESQKHRVLDKTSAFGQTLTKAREEVKEAVEALKVEAQQASASLKDLFALGRKGLKGQMEAHLAEETWQGEKISASAFRQCYAMVSQTVKALGIPSDQKKFAHDAIVEEVAASIRSTHESLELAPGNDDEIEH